MKWKVACLYQKIFRTKAYTSSLSPYCLPGGSLSKWLLRLQTSRKVKTTCSKPRRFLTRIWRPRVCKLLEKSRNELPNGCNIVYSSTEVLSPVKKPCFSRMNEMCNDLLRNEIESNKMWDCKWKVCVRCPMVLISLKRIYTDIHAYFVRISRK